MNLNLLKVELPKDQLQIMRWETLTTAIPSDSQNLLRNKSQIILELLKSCSISSIRRKKLRRQGGLLSLRILKWKMARMLRKVRLMIVVLVLEEWSEIQWSRVWKRHRYWMKSKKKKLRFRHRRLKHNSHNLRLLEIWSLKYYRRNQNC